MMEVSGLTKLQSDVAEGPTPPSMGTCPQSNEIFFASTRSSSREGRPLPGFPSTTGGRRLKESSTRIIYLLALLAIESHGPFLQDTHLAKDAGQASCRRQGKEKAQLQTARRERLLRYVDSLSDVLALDDDTTLRAMVTAACQDGGLVSLQQSCSEADAEEDCYVLVQTVPELVEDLVREVGASCPSPLDSAWLSLVVKVLITYQVRAHLYDARARASFRRLSQRLGPDLLPWSEVVAIESALAVECSSLLANAGADPPRCQSVTRYAKVACAALGGGALMLYTGSVAAPSIAASLVALCTAGGMGLGPAAAAITQQLTSSTATLLSYWGLTSDLCISSFLAVTGVGLTGYKMTQRTRGLTEFHFVPLHSSFPLGNRDREAHASKRGTEECQQAPRDDGGAAASSFRGSPGLPVFICVPGWVEHDQDPRRVWGGDMTTVSAFSREAGGGRGKDTGGRGREAEAGSRERKEAEEGGGESEEEGASMGKSVSSDGSLGSWEALEVESNGWWREVVPGGEEHVLIWETALLGQLHRAMREFVWHEASRYAIDEVIKHTALAGLTSAAALPLSVLTAAQKLDSPWQLAVLHAQEAGVLLANLLALRPQGSRPVTLMGFSMGARVIFHCLEALASKGEAGLGIVENAVLLGLPMGRASERWRQALTVVAGRLVNGYSTRDWVLQFLFRSKAWELGLAGVGPVEVVGEGGRRVENLDLSELVPGHLSYPKALPNIMALLRLEG